MRPLPYIMSRRLAPIDIVTLDSAVAGGSAGQRALRLLHNRYAEDPQRPPHLLIMLHSENDRAAAELFAAAAQPLCQAIQVVEEKSRNKTVPVALALHAQHFEEVAEPERKERILLLSRRGGGGKPEFIAPFVGGAGTTCGTWTPIVAYQQGKTTWIAGTRSKEEETQATAIRGFLRGNYAQGVCPAECRFCYLRGLQGMGVKSVSLNLEDAFPELDALPPGSVVNWAELGGPVEEDPWFVDAQGDGSLVQTIIDASTERRVVAFFLTKGVYEEYLRLDGRLALLAISLNAPGISEVFEPGGAPPEQRLQGLARAIDAGLMDHTIRLGPLIPAEGYQQEYEQLFEMMADILGQRLRRITVDILRFSPQMPRILRASFPESVVSALLTEMESEVRAHKYRPSSDRQLELYQWVRTLLKRYGLEHVLTTPCKAEPGEARAFLKAGVIGSMPCACHISYNDRARISQGLLPIIQGSSSLPL